MPNHLKRRLAIGVRLRAFAAALAIALIGGMWIGNDAVAQSNPNVRPPASAVGNAQPQRPVTTADEGGNYDIELWKKLRQGAQGKVSIPDAKSGILVQAEGAEWTQVQRTELPQWGGYAMAAMLSLLVLFYIARGKMRIEGGPAGVTITRFSALERASHWLMAVSFVVQGLTGLIALYGRDWLIPIIGKASFASMAHFSKLIHAYVAFAFMVGLTLSFILWVRHNFPNRHDIVWLAKGGGMFSKHSHPPARKFNAGQKILFWMIMIGGVSLSLSGISLLIPFEFSLFAKTFTALNVFGLNLPTELTPIQEMQYAVTWHSIVALALLCVIFAHIYIGTIGMEGAFDAMGSGEVDLNWAKEHHSLWVEEEMEKDRVAPHGTHAQVHPAE